MLEQRAVIGLRPDLESLRESLIEVRVGKRAEHLRERAHGDAAVKLRLRFTLSRLSSRYFEPILSCASSPASE